MDTMSYDEATRSLADILDALDHSKRMVDEGLRSGEWSLSVTPGEITAYIKALEQERMRLSIFVFVHDARERMRSATRPTPQDHARATLAQHFATPPLDGDDLAKWQVAFPYVFAEQPDRPDDIGETEKRDRKLCWDVCSEITRDPNRTGKRQRAIDAVNKRYGIGPRTIEIAFDTHKNDEFMKLMFPNINRKK